MKLSLGYITTPTKKEAKEIAMELLESGLIACANIISGVESYFIWEDEPVKANEYIIIFKTRVKNERKIIKLVRNMHSYQCPCVVFMKIEDGNPEFLNWVERSC
ncbi:divalent-cation tolerance protein CutA [Candidatus Peregrinibacteria bacterium]|nr:divalent-cation tolerance protein CutA [Candidatus Peregrinibacteria bacterium]